MESLGQGIVSRQAQKFGAAESGDQSALPPPNSADMALA
jgi:hypothetical protein